MTMENERVDIFPIQHPNGKGTQNIVCKSLYQIYKWNSKGQSAIQLEYLNHQMTNLVVIRFQNMESTKYDCVGMVGNEAGLVNNFYQTTQGSTVHMAAAQ